MDTRLVYHIVKGIREIKTLTESMVSKFSSAITAESKVANSLVSQSNKLGGVDTSLGLLKGNTGKINAVYPNKLKSKRGYASTSQTISVNGSGFLYCLDSEGTGVTVKTDGTALASNKSFKYVPAFLPELYNDGMTYEFFSGLSTTNIPSQSSDSVYYFFSEPARFESSLQITVPAGTYYRILYYLD